jgi:hypothetical protein
MQGDQMQESSSDEEDEEAEGADEFHYEMELGDQRYLYIVLTGISLI